MRLEARLKLGFYPLPIEHGPSIRARLQFPPKETPATVLDPCAGAGAALKAITKNSNSLLYGVELDANRAESAQAVGIPTIHGNIFDVRCRVERLSLLYLNPPYDFEIGPVGNKRMEKLFFGHTYAWLKPKGVLVMVIPGRAIEEILDTLSTRFNDVRVYRMMGAEAEKYNQYAVFAVRHNNTAKDADAIRSYIRHMTYNRNVQPLTSEADCVYKVPAGGEVVLTYSGIPLDDVEDRLFLSGAWSSVAPMLLPRKEVTGGRPITPLHGGHVGLLATAGMINGVFGDDDEKHIARWRPVKYTSVSVEEEEDGTEIVRTKERFSNELALVFTSGDTMVLNEAEKDENKEGAAAEPPSTNRNQQSWRNPDGSYIADEKDDIEEMSDDELLAELSANSDDEKGEGQTEASLSIGALTGARFEIGHLGMSRGVQELVTQQGLDLTLYLNRHISGDWGDLEPFDRQRNEAALNRGDVRLLSSYEFEGSPDGKFWIITEADRSETTFLLPQEY
jgi:hypothetical protein